MIQAESILQVADRCVPTLGAAQHLDAEDAARAGVVRDLEDGLRLDHVALSCTRHRFCLESGRVSMIFTLSPTWYVFSSS